MKFIFTIPLADREMKTNANTLAEAMEEAKRFNCSELANNPEYDYTMLQVEDLDNGRVFDVFTYPGKGNRADVKHEITEYDWYGNEVDKQRNNHRNGRETKPCVCLLTLMTYLLPWKEEKNKKQCRFA